MADNKTQGEILQAEFGEKAAAVIARIFEKAAVPGVDKNKAQSWIDNQKPIGPAHLEVLKPEMSAAAFTELELAAADLRMNPQTTTQAAPAAAAEPEGMSQEEVRALKQAAADAFSAVLKETPLSDKERRARRDNGRGLTGEEHVVIADLANRKGMKLSAGTLRAMAAGRERITTDQAAMIEATLGQSVPEDAPEFDGAAQRFREAVGASQAAWDRSDEIAEAHAAAREARRAERKAAAKGGSERA